MELLRHSGEIIAQRYRIVDQLGQGGSGTTYHAEDLQTEQRVALKALSPEQFRGQAVPATDLYGLGATLLFLLTHRSPADLPTDGLTIKLRSYIL